MIKILQHTSHYYTSPPLHLPPDTDPYIHWGCAVLTAIILTPPTGWFRDDFFFEKKKNKHSSSTLPLRNDCWIIKTITERKYDDKIELDPTALLFMLASFFLFSLFLSTRQRFSQVFCIPIWLLYRIIVYAWVFCTVEYWSLLFLKNLLCVLAWYQKNPWLQCSIL